MSEFNERIAGLSPEKRALLERLVLKKPSPPIRQQEIRRRETNDPCILSFAQERLWFFDQFEPGSQAYNIFSAMRLAGHLNATALEQSLGEVLRRHEVLRTTFVTESDHPVQRISPATAYILPRIDLSTMPEEQREAKVRQLAGEEASRAFDLTAGPLIRAILLKLTTREHVLLLTVHHIVFDGWSWGILYRELSALYKIFLSGNPSSLPELPIQYADFALWQRQWLQGKKLEEQLAFWKKHLTGVPPLELPTDRRRPSVQTFHGATSTFEFPESLTEALRGLSRKEGATLFMTLLAAFQCLLHRYTGQDDTVVGIPIANRNRAEMEGLIGFFVNTLVIRTDTSGNPVFRELLKQIKKTALDAYTYQDLPLEKLVEELHPERDLSRNPLFQVMFAMQNMPVATLEMSGLTPCLLETERTMTRFDLEVHLQETGEGIKGKFVYNIDLFNVDTIERMIRHYRTLLEGIAENPDQRLSELPLLTEAERHQLLAEWNDTTTAYPRDRCIHSLFEEQAERTPDAIAVTFEERQMTYRDLNSSANKLAHYLMRQGVGAEVLVGLCVERSLEMIVGILGILKAGGAYVPLDPTYPKERLAFMLEDSQATVLLTQQRLATRLPEIDAQVVCLDASGYLASEAKLPDANPAGIVASEDLAYVIFTSGSTGLPKGVAVEHRQLVNYVRGVSERMEFEPSWNFALVSTLAADLGNTVIFPALCIGGTLHVISQERAADPPALAEYFEQNRIDCLKIVPSHLAALMTGLHPEKLMPRRRLILGGEASHCEWVKGLRKLAPDCIIFNHYGPTETTVGVLTHRVGKEQPSLPSGTLPLGRPLPNTQIYILDEHQRLVPIGVAGELYIGGDGVARGYMNRPELTAERFVPNRLCNGQGALLYRTGDRTRYRSDGNIEFLGRIDRQVKIRGFRIEPGEIETALRSCPGVRDAAVIPHDDTAGSSSLAAYIVPHKPVAMTLPAQHLYKLPNNLLVAHLNKNETDYIYREIFELQAYLRHGITVNDGDVVFDVGANIGLFTVFVNQICKRPQVYAFEPNPVVHEFASVNARAYGAEVKVFPYGLSSEDATAELTFFEGFSLLSGFYSDVEKEKQVVKNFLINQQQTAQADMTELIEQADELLEERFKARRFTANLRALSGVIAEEKVDRIDLLKINAEKSEWHVLRGIEEADWQKIRQIVLEVDLSEHLPPVTALLKKHGYEYVIEQDALLDGTELCYIYAIRPAANRRLIRGQTSDGHRLKLPVFSDTVLSTDDLRRHLLQRLPDYMAPSRYVLLEALPLTPGGKVDRRALQKINPDRSAFENAPEGPRGPVEDLLAGIWCNVLGLKKVGIHDNFFELGGHSLLATQVMSRLRKVFQVEMPLRSFFESPTIAGLAVRIAQSQAEVADKEELGRILDELEGTDSDPASGFREIGDKRYE